MKILSVLERAVGLLYLMGRAFSAKKEIKNNKVLIVASGHLGDALVDASAIIAMKDKFVGEGKEVYFLCTPSVWSLLKLIPEAKGLVGLPYLAYNYSGRSSFSLSRTRDTVERLDSEGYELVIGLIIQPSVFYLCAGIPGRKIICMSPVIKHFHPKVNNFFLKYCEKVVFWEQNESRFVGTERFVQGLGLADFCAKVVRLEQLRKSKVPVTSNYCSIVVDSSNPNRRWPDSFFLELITRLLERYDSDICILGVKVRRELQDKLSSLSARFPGRLHDFLDKTTLYEWVDLIRNSTFIVGVDSGAIHVAAATGTQSYCLAGAWSNQRFVPYPSQVLGDGILPPICVYRRDIELIHCAGCLEKSGKTGETDERCYEVCKKGEPCMCLQEIHPSQVLEVIAKNFPPSSVRI